MATVAQVNAVIDPTKNRVGPYIIKTFVSGTDTWFYVLGGARNSYMGPTNGRDQWVKTATADNASTAAGKIKTALKG